jgi:hypothetical protein
MRAYSDDSYDMLVSTSFKVTGDDPPQGDERIKIDGTTFKINEIIKVKYSGLNKNKKYKIGAFPRGTTNNDNPIKKRNIKNSTEGTRKFKMPTAGKFEFHLYLKMSDNILDKIEFTIEDEGPPPQEASFELNKKVYDVDERIKVTYKNLPGNETDWIGIFQRNAPHDEYMEWFYTDGNKNGTMMFNGLEAGKYDMRLFFNDSYNLEYEVQFTVEGGTPSDGWTFVVAGDTRSQDSKHRMVLNSIRKHSSDYKFYLNSGDVVADGRVESQWRTWKEAVSDILTLGQSMTPPKYISCPGNHDEVGSSTGLSNWKKYLPGQTRYGNDGKHFTYTYKNARFIILNSDTSTSSQMNFLRNAVNKTKKTWLFAMWHHPNMYSNWVGVLKDANYDGVFHGHEHNYERRKVGNAFKIRVGTGGAPLYNGGDYSTYGHLECNVDGNIMKVKFIQASSGKVLDSATYTANLK